MESVPGTGINQYHTPNSMPPNFTNNMPSTNNNNFGSNFSNSDGYYEDGVNLSGSSAMIQGSSVNIGNAFMTPNAIAALGSTTGEGGESTVFQTNALP